MTHRLQSPFLVRRATCIPTAETCENRSVYDDQQMMNVTLDGGAPTHSILNAAEQGGTRKTGVDRETTDDS